jgi:hypothetical protein
VQKSTIISHQDNQSGTKASGVANHMSHSEELIIYCVPSLVATLLNREQAKGSPLTEEEVLQIRDSSPAIALHPEVAREMDEKRGYKDINPDYCWEQWQEARKDFINDDSIIA